MHLDSQTILSLATLITATGAAIAGVISAIRTKNVANVVDTHTQRIQDVASVVEHTAEALDNHITDEQPVINAAKAHIELGATDG